MKRTDYINKWKWHGGDEDQRVRLLAYSFYKEDLLLETDEMHPDEIPQALSASACVASQTECNFREGYVAGNRNGGRLRPCNASARADGYMLRQRIRAARQVALKEKQAEAYGWKVAVAATVAK